MDDIVFLFGLGKKTQWKFPKISYCPHPSCQEEFENRNQAIDHFRCVHSQSVILCSECFKPIFTYSIDGFKEHYRSSHPDAEIPYDFNETSTNYHMPPLDNEVGPPNDEVGDFCQSFHRFPSFYLIIYPIFRFQCRTMNAMMRKQTTNKMI